MKVDHQQNHQKYLKESSKFKIYFCYYQAINNKSQPNLNINICFSSNSIDKDLKNLNNKYNQAK